MRANSNGSCERAAAICAAWRQELGHDRHLKRCSPNADSVYDLIDKSSIFCIKSSQLYISVAPVTISDNTIYLSHIMPTDAFWHFEPFKFSYFDFKYIRRESLSQIGSKTFVCLTSSSFCHCSWKRRRTKLLCFFSILIQVWWLLLCFTGWLSFLPCIKWFWFRNILSQCLLQMPMQLILMTQVFWRLFLSSLRAESAMAVTGRRCPHSGKGEDFLTRQPIFFLKTAVPP